MKTIKGKTLTEGTLLSMLLVILMIVHACGKDKDEEPGPGPNPPAKLEITGFTPTHGTPGTEITITGKNFKDNVLQNEVRFQGASLGASVVEAKPTSLKVLVPQDAVTGKVTVKVGNETATSPTNFTVDPEVFSITDFTPKQGPVGTPVTITGTKFSNNITVKINGITATIQSKSATRIVFLIPTNTTLTSHKIQVTSGTEVLETAQPFTVITNGDVALWEYAGVDVSMEELLWHGLSFVQGNKLYWGFTGISVFDNNADYFTYDPVATPGDWTFMFEPPAELAHGKLQKATAVVHNNRVFMGTGLNAVTGNVTFSNKWFEFHPAPVTQQSTATRLTDFPHEVQGAVSFVLNDKIYVGFGNTNKKLYRFDPAANANKGAWTFVLDAPFSELNSGSAVVIGNAAYFGRALPQVLGERKGFYKFTEATGITRMTDLPEDDGSLITPSFVKDGKGYFIIGKKVWEYTPDATTGTWRIVIAHENTPSIAHVQTLEVNGSKVIYGWANTGTLYKFKMN